jgi:hypothetical protein
MAMQYDPQDDLPRFEYVLQATSKRGDTITIRKHERLGYICRDQKQDWIGDWSDTSEKGLKYFKRRISEYYGGLGRWQVVRLEKK